MLLDALKHRKTSDLGILDQVSTFGLHPWLIPQGDLNKILGDLKGNLAQKPDLLAIGECGLDRAREGLVDIEIQKAVFCVHLEVAMEKNLPVIIHCVRAFSDIFEVLKKAQPKIPLMFHAFNGNEEIVKELLKYNSFFSQGESVFKNSSKLHVIPLDRLVLESGDQDQVSLLEIYQKAKSDLKEERLEAIIEENFLKLFNSHHISSADFIKKLDMGL